MIYLTGVANDAIDTYAESHRWLGLMAQPRSAVLSRRYSYSTWAFDNGAFGYWRRGAPFPFPTWERQLATLPPGALFVVVPDVVCDHAATLALWREWSPLVRGLGHEAAFVLQNGCESLSDVPPDARTLFIGGDDLYKLGHAAAHITWEARDDGRWVHMGRVNSRERYLRALSMGCDSADGTFLRFGFLPDMLRQVASWNDAASRLGGQLDVLDVA